MGKGSEPERYHSAVAVQISTTRLPSPYQSTVMRCHTVLGSCKTVSSDGKRFPTTRGRPIVCEEEQVPTEFQRRPARSIEHLVKPTKAAIQMMASLPQRC